MKSKFIKSIAYMMLSVAVISCAEDNTSDIIINVNGTGGTISGGTESLSGNITSNLTLDATKEYTITGPTVIESGATLTIPAGMTIKAAATGADVYLAIAQGGKIMAEGTSAQPIVLTSAAQTPNAGDWGH